MLTGEQASPQTFPATPGQMTTSSCSSPCGVVMSRRSLPWSTAITRASFVSPASSSPIRRSPKRSPRRPGSASCKGSIASKGAPRSAPGFSAS